MLKRILLKFPIYDIEDPDGTLYLRRYTLFKCRLFKVMVHHMVKPDHTRDRHDHPWRFITLILKGGYIETTPIGQFHRKPGRIYAHGIHFQHTITELPKGEAWTLVVRGQRLRDWGFITECGWQIWTKYNKKFYAGLPICEEGKS